MVVPRDVSLPLDVHSRLMCRFRSGEEFYMVKIIEKRESQEKPGDAKHVEYYVHYEAFNRRLDTWVSLMDFDLGTLEKPRTKEAAEAQPSKDDGEKDPKKKKQKRDNDKNDVKVENDGVAAENKMKGHGGGHGNAHPDPEHAEFDPRALQEHEEFTKVRNILSIELGNHEMDTWYFSPFPPEYNGTKKLYFCEYTLAFFKRKEQLQRHLKKCKVQHPPGEEIYRNGKISFFEIDGKKHKMFCQNLCYLAKLFLDHKTLYYDVDLFLFYVLCEWDERGYHVVGYFSKEKCSEEGYNLACILTLPPYQRKGYGKLLIAFSYELSKKEGKVGTPERPLSDLGLVSYRGYWTRELLALLADPNRQFVSIKDLSDLTMIKTEDIITTLQHLNLLAYQKGAYVICAAPDLIQKHLKNAGGPGVKVDAKKIIWTPFNADKEYEKYRG